MSLDTTSPALHSQLSQIFSCLVALLGHWGPPKKQKNQTVSTCLPREDNRILEDLKVFYITSNLGVTKIWSIRSTNVDLGKIIPCADTRAHYTKCQKCLPHVFVTVTSSSPNLQMSPRGSHTTPVCGWETLDKSTDRLMSSPKTWG